MEKANCGLHAFRQTCIHILSIYMYIHCGDKCCGSSIADWWYLYIYTQEANTVQVPDVASEKSQGLGSSVVLSFVTATPRHILTRSGHIFNLWPLHYCWVLLRTTPERIEGYPERIAQRQRVCLCPSQSSVNCLDAVCHYSPVTRLSCFYCAICSCYETAFRGRGYENFPYTEAGPGRFTVLWRDGGSLWNYICL